MIQYPPAKVNRAGAGKRRALLRLLDLPEQMSTNAMLQALNLLYTRQALSALLEEKLEKHDD